MRLIDADRLKAHYCWWSGGTKEMTIDEAKKTFDTIIDVQPTVDAEPVRHGKWLKNGDRYCECSVCHHEGNISGADIYCWYCGAKMDEVEDE